MTSNKITTKTKHIVNNNKTIFMIFISIAALLIRFKYLNQTSDDYNGFLQHWVNHLRENGGFSAISTVRSDYNAIYLYFLASFTYLPINDLYLIKFLSIIFDFVLAFSGSLLISHIKKDSEFKNLYSSSVFAVILLNPTVILNSSWWAQCDSIYVSFLLLSLYFMLRKKYNLSFILYGVSITFKLQAIFLIPAYGIIYLKNKEFSILKFLWMPIVNFILYIPAIMLGKPITSVLDAYLVQTGSYSDATTLNYPNIYYFFPIDDISLIKPGVVLTMILLFTLMFFVLFTKGKLTDTQIIELSLTVLFLVTYFLPKMHERYGFAAEVLAIVYFFIIKKDWIILALININIFIAYACYLIFPAESLPKTVASYQLIIVMYFVIKFINTRVKRKNATASLSNVVTV